jgi:hypothetical protein
MRISGILLTTLILGLAACSSEPANRPVLRYNMGEKVPVGHLTYTVFETQWATHFGDGVSARVPQNRFFLVRLSAVNGGVADAPIPNATIEDDAGHTYNELSDGDGVPQWIGYLRSAKPADFVQGNLVFDAPPGHYKLRVSDTGQNAALVDMPLTFGAETPEITPVGPPEVTVGKPPEPTSQKK